MNTLTLNNASLDGDVVVKRGGGSGGGVPINNQEKSVDIVANGTTDVTPDAGFTGLSKVLVNVNVPSSGGGAVVSSGAVTFYDYDGVVLHSYTKDEFLALSAMPELPEREGLICQGWNYNLEDAIAYVSEYGVLDVGATYITDDGKTRLYIRIATKGRMDVPLYFSQTVANGVTIDWGDGSETQTLSGTGNVNTTHKYAEIGDYVITLDPIEGCTLGFGRSSGSYSVMGSTSGVGPVYCNMLQKVEVGRGVTSISNKAFSKCYSLSSAVIPQGVTSIGKEVFYQCSSLSSAVIPQGVTSIGNDVFTDCSSLSSAVIPQGVTSIDSKAFCQCYSLSSVVIPQGVTSTDKSRFYFCRSLALVVIPQDVTSIDDYAFFQCYSLSSVVIPQGVTSIGQEAFYGCSSVAFFDFRTHTSIPTLDNSSAFNSTSSDCKIIVPDDLYDTWIAATNWSSHASKIIKKTDWDASQA